MKNKYILFYITIIFANYTYAQKFDLGSWNIVNLKYNLSNKWSAFGETQVRSLKFYNHFHYYEYKGGVNYKTEGWADEIKSLSNGIDVIIDSALGDGFEQHFKYTNPGTRIVFFGATAGDLPSLNPRIIFWKQIQILGTTMGNAKEFEAMVEFINKHKIIPVVDEVFKLNDINDAFLAMENAKQFGKIVLSID